MLRSCPTRVDGKGRRHTRRDVLPVRRPPSPGRSGQPSLRVAVQLGLDATETGVDTESSFPARCEVWSPAATRQREFGGRPIRPPISSSSGPGRRAVEWHRREVLHP